MSDLYRFEVCSVCRVVRLGLITAMTRKRETDGADRPEHVAGVPVWPIEFCDPCRKEYESSGRR